MIIYNVLEEDVSSTNRNDKAWGEFYGWRKVEISDGCENGGLNFCKHVDKLFFSDNFSAKGNSHSYFISKSIGCQGGSSSVVPKYIFKPSGMMVLKKHGNRRGVFGKGISKTDVKGDIRIDKALGAQLELVTHLESC